MAVLFTANDVPGAAVPIPTLPVEKSYTNPEVSIASPPAKVEVALVDVAVKYPASAELPRADDPSTESVVYGEVVPMPTFPFTTMNWVEVATPVEEEAMTKAGAVIA